MSTSGGRRSAALAALCVIALACEEPERPPPPEQRAAEPQRPPEPPARPGACVLDEPVVVPGAPMALAANALIVRDRAGLRLVRLDEPARAVPLDAESVPRRGLVARGSSLLVLARTAAGPAVLVIEGDAVQRIALGEGSLADGALSARGDHAIAAWVDGEGALRTSRIDLLRARAGEPETLATIGESAPLVAATRSGAVVSWTAARASLVTLRESSSTRADAPGLVLDLLGGPEGAGVLHEAADRTGVWLSSDGAPAVRVTHPEARPAAPSITALPDGSVVAYREGADIFVQRLAEDAIPRGGPVVAGSSAEGAPHAPPLLASEEGRVWIAWASGSETARVRSAVCP